MSMSSHLSRTVGPVIILALGAVSFASAQSASPFANKKKKQAWETAAPVNSVPPAPTYTPPAPANTGSYAPPSYVPPAPLPSNAQPSATYSSPAPSPAAAPVQTYSYSAPSAPTAQPSYQGQHTYGAQTYPVTPYGQNAGQSAGQSAGQYQPQSGSPYQPQTFGNAGYGAQNYGAQNYGTPNPNIPQTRESWKDKLGLGRIATALSGRLRIGAAATNRDNGVDSDWGEDFIADGDVELEVSSITQGGIEYGVNLGVRGQYDKYRRGFGQRLADCPPIQAGCPSSLGAIVPTGLRGHTSQFYATGEDDAKKSEFALESAHLFLRTAYGDVTVGRDDGAAYLFSLGAPSLLAIGASNSPVDYTGLDSVKTVNDASGFSEKITYTTPRLLGDRIGVGVQLGASYAPNARACGVDYCVRRDAVAGVITPDIEDVLEVGIALDRTFGNGLSIEGAASYARGSEASGLAGLDDLEAINAGVEVKLSDWTLGGSWLTSNNGLLDGDYEAYDVGLTWKPSRLGFTLGYGHATEDNVGLTSDQAVFGVTYEFDRFTLGTGVQYVDRTTTGFNGVAIAPVEEKATSIFVEGGFTF